MEIIHLDINNIKPIAPRLSLCLGYFDGLHLGHQKVIKEAVSQSIGPVAVVTFSHAPGFLSKKHKQEMVLMSNDTKAKLLEKIGVKFLLVIDADQKLIKMTADQFLIKVLTKLKPVALYCGPDYRFGYLRIGNVDLLKKYFKVNVVEELKIGEEKISSTKIIFHLRDGELAEANQLLGREYSIEGTVVPGQKIGRTLGFPTANIQLQIPFALPKNGVYITRLQIEKEVYFAITSVGTRPTFDNDGKILVEAHIPGFNGDLYGKKVELAFLVYLREEMKFENTEDLKAQLQKDLNQFNDFVLQKKK